MTGCVDSVESVDSGEYLESNISHHSPSLTPTELSPPVTQKCGPGAGFSHPSSAPVRTSSVQILLKQHLFRTLVYLVTISFAKRGG